MEAIPSTPAHRPRSSMPVLARLLIALSVFIAALWFVAARGFWEDDAYIHLEFARSLAAGHGFSFNHHIVYGDTSPVWVWLLVAFHAIVPGTSPESWLTAGKTLTAVASLVTLAGVFAFARSLAHRWLHHAAADTFAATMLFAFVLSPYFGYWAFSGMEALAAAGLACCTCTLIAPRHLSGHRVLFAALLAGLAPLLRPEMAFFTLLIALVLFQRIRQMHLSLTLRIDAFVAALFLLATPAIAWGFYAARTFGSILPNTNAAKRAGPTDSVLLRLFDLYGFGYPVTLLACLLLAVYFVKHRRAFTTHAAHAAYASPLTALHLGGWLIFLWTAINTAFYLTNHTLVQTRYIFITAPVLTVALFAFAAIRWPRLYRPLIALTLLYSAFASLIATRPLVRNKVAGDAIYAELASFMQTLPADAPVALYAIGEPTFLSQHPVVDTGGITRPGVIPFIHDPTDTRVTAWIYTQQARYEVIDHPPVPGSQLLWSRDLPATGWSLDPRRYAATERLQLWQLPPLSAQQIK